MAGIIARGGGWRLGPTASSGVGGARTESGTAPFLLGRTRPVSLGGSGAICRKSTWMAGGGALHEGARASAAAAAAAGAGSHRSTHGGGAAAAAAAAAWLRRSSRSAACSLSCLRLELALLRELLQLRRFRRLVRHCRAQLGDLPQLLANSPDALLAGNHVGVVGRTLRLHPDRPGEGSRPGPPAAGEGQGPVGRTPGPWCQNGNAFFIGFPWDGCTGSGCDKVARFLTRSNTIFFLIYYLAVSAHALSRALLCQGPARVRHARATDAGTSGIDLDGTPHSHAPRNRICENTNCKY
eukprot:scaffold3347_cov110-Isochrysis_galbana.AAC.4